MFGRYNWLKRRVGSKLKVKYYSEIELRDFSFSKNVYLAFTANMYGNLGFGYPDFSWGWVKEGCRWVKEGCRWVKEGWRWVKEGCRWVKEGCNVRGQGGKLFKYPPLINRLFSYHQNKSDKVVFSPNSLVFITLLNWIIIYIWKRTYAQGNNARKVNCGCAFSVYILKPVLSGRYL